MTSILCLSSTVFFFSSSTSHKKPRISQFLGLLFPLNTVGSIKFSFFIFVCVKGIIKSMEKREEMSGEEVGRFDPSVTVMTSKKVPLNFASAVALFLWMGLIQFAVILLLLSFALMPTKWGIWGYTLCAVLGVLCLLPVDGESEWANSLTEFVCRHIKGYFPMTVIVEDINAFDPTQAYVLAAEPHSILPMGIMSLCKQMGFLPLTKVRALGSSAIFKAPIVRQAWTWMGCIPATRKSFVKYLNSGFSVIVIPGGLKEVFYMRPGKEVVYLKKRHGFVRVAIETGSPLVPVFNFGQTSTYSWWRPSSPIYTRFCNLVRCSPLLFWGPYGAPIPHSVPLHIVVGKPITVKKNPQPSTEEVLEVHAQYVSAIQELYEKHKVAAGYKDIPLDIL